ncbi:uncharacterized mitochondrial protein AtMg00810-like [Arachis hypogaea]|uniref:uncharacterized mitochondrial protein AtMg00810-like n=1 Tax=Arachis hypogaea TaxID=3818 RepID=UPI0007AFAC49|nr:uncharacterized protein LOC112743304 [Arachis hypogaea]
MVQPQGYVHHNSSLVCKLNKAIYGLKQAPRAWFKTLADTLYKFGFKSTKSDVSLFVRHNSSNVTYLLVYVDDIIVTGNNSQEIETLISQLHEKFSLKDLGRFNYFLGLEATYLPHGDLLISQMKYAKELLLKAGMNNSKPLPTPMSTDLKLYSSDSEPFENPTKYRSIVGALQYLTMTRPDITFAVNRVSQFAHEPTLKHWKSVKRILRYVQGTVEHGIVFTKSTNFRILAFADSDWGGDLEDRKSITGFCVYLDNNLISWKSSKQTKPTPPTIYCDNQSAYLLAANPILHSRCKHLELDLHFLRDLVNQKSLFVAHIPSPDQVADCLTKPLSQHLFDRFRHKLRVFLCPYLSLRRGIRDKSEKSELESG